MTGAVRLVGGRPATDEEIDAAIAALAVERTPRALPTLSRGQVSALVVAALAAAIAAVAAAAQASTRVGVATAHCGIDVFVYGYPDGAAEHACRHLEAGRAVVFVLAAAVGLVALGVAMAPLLRTPRLIVAGLGAAGAIVAALALRPATAELTSAGSLRTLHCGLDSYLWGYADPAINHACHRAYGSHLTVLVPALLVSLAVAGGVLAARGRRVVVRVSLVAALAVMLVGALRPVSVVVNEGGSAFVASCGLDSVVAGYPDKSVQSACRSHVDDHLVEIGALILLGIVGAAAVRKEAFS
jgi:hypothetical protein